ncbi:MAG TPA: TetR family transcriptional regulator [Pseudolysinimonas sp.]|nr:TetR family transcriptional regulator [Pseudolysinimonas sp.]
MTTTAGRVPYGEGRKAIVRAAIGEVAERGLSRMTYRTLAARAGVTHGSVQHNFDSIEQVLEEALQLCLELGVMPMQEAKTPAEFVDSVVDMVNADPAVHSFQFELILEARRRPSFRPHVERLYAAYWDAMKHALDSMRLDSSEEMVRALFAALEGLVFQMVTVAAEDSRGSHATTDGLRRVLASAPPAVPPAVPRT